MACDFLNISLNKLNSTVSNESASNGSRNWKECYKGLQQYGSDEDLANVRLFLDYPEELLQFAAICCIIFTIIGIPGNLITIIALWNYKKVIMSFEQNNNVIILLRERRTTAYVKIVFAISWMFKVRNATAIFIISLSTSDLLYCCIIFPITTELFLKKTWTTGKIMCLLFPYINYSLCATGVFTIVAITFNRYIMVSHPIHYPRIYKSRNIAIMVFAIWVGSFAMLMPVLFELWGRFSLDPMVGFCTVIEDKNGNTPKTLLIVMAFIFPCIFIIICYSRIMYIVRKSTAKSCSKPANSNVISDSTSRNAEVSTKELTSSDSLEDNTKDDVESNARKFMTRVNRMKFTFKQRRSRNPCPTRRDKRLQTMILAIMISFFAFHLPIMIAKTVKKNLSEEPYGNMMGYMLLYATTCSNPIIYVVMSKEYRQAYKHIFTFSKIR